MAKPTPMTTKATANAQSSSSAKQQQHQETARKPKRIQTRVTPQPLRADVDNVMKKSPILFKYLPTKLGPGKVSVDGVEYLYHFKSNGVNFWRCEKRTCTAKVITKNSYAWMLNETHEHQE